ncbi:hypothetical protein ZWY2020_045984 [Hordeum vulgare]|nr:hypothetical protein ZWY2020_045984 [Hordeum vulgare]
MQSPNSPAHLAGCLLLDMLQFRPEWSSPPPSPAAGALERKPAIIYVAEAPQINVAEADNQRALRRPSGAGHARRDSAFQAPDARVA